MLEHMSVNLVDVVQTGLAAILVWIIKKLMQLSERVRASEETKAAVAAAREDLRHIEERLNERLDRMEDRCFRQHQKPER